MNFLKMVIAGLFLAVTTLTATAGSDPVVPSPSVVIMEQANGSVQCTAVHVGDGNFLTAAHCFFQLKYPSDFGFVVNNEPVYIVWTHIPLDIVMVKVTTLGEFPAAEVACRDPILDEPIVVEGNNKSWGWIRSPGVVTGLKVEYEDSKYAFLHNGNYVSGMSGGPLWDSEGKLLGINAAFVTENPSISIANPLDILCINIPGTEKYEEREEKRKKNK